MLATVIHISIAGTWSRIQNLIVWILSDLDLGLRTSSRWIEVSIIFSPIPVICKDADSLRHTERVCKFQLSITPTVFRVHSISCSITILVPGRLILFHKYLRSVKFRSPNCDWVEEERERYSEDNVSTGCILTSRYPISTKSARDSLLRAHCPPYSAHLFQTNNTVKRLGWLSSQFVSAHPHWDCSQAFCSLHRAWGFGQEPSEQEGQSVTKWPTRWLNHTDAQGNQELEQLLESRVTESQFVSCVRQPSSSG